MQSKRRFIVYTVVIWTLLAHTASGQETTDREFAWPDGKRAAISFTFDDGRTSQVDVGAALLRKHRVRATFYVTPSSVERRLRGWKQVVADGHEIGNHSLVHPCSGNFEWSRDKALENYTLEQMEKELVDANHRIHQLLDVTPTTFAYPCGQTFVGRGEGLRSYIPLVARLFLAGRGCFDETANDPAFCDLAQLTGIELDGQTFDEILPLLREVAKSGRWLVLAGHEVGSGGQQTTRIQTLERIFEYVHENNDTFWVAPVAEIAEYIKAQREDAEFKR